MHSPQKSGFFQPAEWALHSACWLAWPSHADLWRENLEAAQTEFTALCHAIADVDGATGQQRGERLEILALDEISLSAAQSALAGLDVNFHLIPFGDIWLRDTAPIFLTNREREIVCVKFKFNGWGEKYSLPFDTEVSENIAKASGLETFSFKTIMEGGSLEVDGEGTCLTSIQCLLNPNRNPGMTKGDLEAELAESLGIEKVLWLKDGLLNDHTDGHIDTIARFTSPGVAVCMKAVDPSNDVNHRVYEEIASDLANFTDAKGRKLTVIRIPSPGEILSEEGMILPASYLNFYIGNTTVVVPTYGSAQDETAVKEIAKLFPGRRTVGSSALAILTGGGAFHCITQQVPAKK